MSILRVEKNGNYVVMNRTALNDKKLSWKAKGIMAYMLSMPDDWVFYMNELTSHSIDGEKSFRTGLKELKDFGYVRRQPIRENNKIVGWETIVSEIPSQTLDNTLLADFVHVGNVQVQKDVLLSTEKKLSTDKTKHTIYSDEFEQFWAIYPRKLDKKKAYTKFKTIMKAHSLISILEGTKKYAKQVQHTEAKFIKHPATFLNNESFIDGYEEQAEQQEQSKPPQRVEESVIAGMWGEEY